jgi:hypothetical protein
MRVPREKLHKEVWAEPMTTVAKRYDVSSNYLARICERLNIPRPGRGHWQQRAVGAEVETQPLPEAQPGDEIEWARDGSAPAIAPMSSEARPRRGNARPETHPLLVGARVLFEQVRAGREVLYVVPRKNKLVDVFVTPATLDWALKVANDLFLFLEDRGYQVVLAPPGRGYQRADLNVREGAKPQHEYGDYGRGSWQPMSPTTALIGDIAIGITIYETMEEADSVWRNGKCVRYEAPQALPAPKRRAPLFAQERVSKHWFPTGRLGLHAYAAAGVGWDQAWIEKRAGDLPTMFEHIAKTFEGAAPRITKMLGERAREQEKRHKEFEEQQKKWGREEEERRSKQEEVARLKRIEDQIASWRTARDIRAYVAEIHGLVADAKLRISEGTSADQDLKWALNYANQIDPLTTWRKDIQRAKAEAAEKVAGEGGEADHGHGGDDSSRGVPSEDSDPSPGTG